MIICDHYKYDYGYHHHHHHYNHHDCYYYFLSLPTAKCRQHPGLRLDFTYILIHLYIYTSSYLEFLQESLSLSLSIPLSFSWYGHG